jgi:hypothetical protein
MMRRATSCGYAGGGFPWPRPIVASGFGVVITRVLILLVAASKFIRYANIDLSSLFFGFTGGA